MPDLLIELGSEEIPARMQAGAVRDLQRLITDGLVEAGLTYGAAAGFATPRRLALTIEGLSPASRPQREERKGPALGAPQAALDGFLRATGLTEGQLQRRPDKKGEVWFAVIDHPGRPAGPIVAEVLDRTIRTFPWPKSMRWGAGALRWVRPLQSILCLLTDEAGSEVVDLDIDGIRAGRSTGGHRIMAPARFDVTGFEDYEARLARAFVLLRPESRAARIRHDAQTLAFAAGLDLVEDPALLAEVAGLVEWPVVLLGRIPDTFLHLPPEVLRTSMKEHQKFFSLRNPATGRIEGFATVANTETPDDGATILAGNTRVLTARLSDARFFYDRDLAAARDGMAQWRKGLAQVTFHARLGSQADRVARIADLARDLAPVVGADPDLAEQAGQVAKLDLRSAMVGEFPELQGVMGRVYALAAGLPAAVADAARDHWKPMGPSDAVPTDPVSVAVALADKIDTLTGFWAIDEKPTGSKDPFALRRAALGVIRLILANDLRLPLLQVFLGPIWANREAMARADPPPQGSIPDLSDAEVERRCALTLGHDLLAFLQDRLKVHLRDQGIAHDVIDACLAMPGNDDLTLLVNRARALADVLGTDDGTNLVQGFRRANNILTQAEQADGVEYSYGADPGLAGDPAEAALFRALDRAEAAIAPALKAEDFAAAMAAMAALRAPIDAFFTAVQINSDNAVLRRNRLNFLHRIRKTCLAVADLARLEG